jgi:hypothetical protein
MKAKPTGNSDTLGRPHALRDETGLRGVSAARREQHFVGSRLKGFPMFDNLMATTAITAPSAALMERMKTDGRHVSGLSNDPADMLTPRLCIAQSNSPQCDKHDPNNFIEGLRPSDLFIASTGMHFDGAAGIQAVYCVQLHCVVQWAAGRNGFIARHTVMPADARQEPVEGKRRPVLVNAAGDTYEQQREIYLLINTGQEWLPVVFSARSTLHTVARKWQTDLHMRCKYNGAVLPTYALTYKLDTVPQRNDLGTWFTLRPDYVGLVTDEAVYEAAKQFAEFVDAGRAFVDHSADLSE